MACHDQGLLNEALAAFRTALVLREQQRDTETTLIARWMTAWTLRLKGNLLEALTEQLLL